MEPASAERPDRAPAVRTVILAHGMGRTRASMWLLGRRLRALGLRTASFGYSVTFEPFADIVDRFVDHAAAAVRPGEGWAVVGHSLGNLITRAAIGRLPEGWRAMVMLAPPNRSPAVARALAGVPLFRVVTRDSGERLQRSDWASDLPLPPVPTLVVAGDAGPRRAWMPFGDRANDGLVAVEETLLPGARCIRVPALHTFLMNRRDVTEEIVAFLRRPPEAAVPSASGRVAGEVPDPEGPRTVDSSR